MGEKPKEKGGILRKRKETEKERTEREEGVWEKERQREGENKGKIPRGSWRKRPKDMDRKLP